MQLFKVEEPVTRRTIQVASSTTTFWALSEEVNEHEKTHGVQTLAFGKHGDNQHCQVHFTADNTY
jgi:hypothetical protein